MTGTERAMTTAAEGLLSALPLGGEQHACYPFTGPPAPSGPTSRVPGAASLFTGITVSRLPEQARRQVRQLLGIYLDRLAPDLADGEHCATDSKITFAWAGGLLAGDAHSLLPDPGTRPADRIR